MDPVQSIEGLYKTFEVVSFRTKSTGLMFCGANQKNGHQKKLVKKILVLQQDRWKSQSSWCEEVHQEFEESRNYNKKTNIKVKVVGVNMIIFKKEFLDFCTRAARESHKPDDLRQERITQGKVTLKKGWNAVVTSYIVDDDCVGRNIIHIL